MEIYDLCEKFPDFEKYGLISQLVRSANSVIANIAESHGRYYFKDKIRTLYISRAEVSETQSHLIVAHGRKYISENTLQVITNKYEILRMGINGYIQHLYKMSAQ